MIIPFPGHISARTSCLRHLKDQLISQWPYIAGNLVIFHGKLHCIGLADIPGDDATVVSWGIPTTRTELDWGSCTLPLPLLRLSWHILQHIYAALSFVPVIVRTLIRSTVRFLPINYQKRDLPRGLGDCRAPFITLFFFLHFFPRLQIGSMVEWNKRKALENLHQTGMFGIVLAFSPLFYFDLLTLCREKVIGSTWGVRSCAKTPLFGMGKAKGRRKCR